MYVCMCVTLVHVESFGNYNWLHLVKCCGKFSQMTLSGEGSSIMYQYSIASETNVK